MKRYQRFREMEKYWSIPKHYRTAVRRRQGGKCAVSWCRERKGLSMHHIVDRKKGGRTEMCNLMLLCDYHHDMAEESAGQSYQAVLQYIEVHDLPRVPFQKDRDELEEDKMIEKTVAGGIELWHRWVLGGHRVPEFGVKYRNPREMSAVDRKINTRRLALQARIRKAAEKLPYSPVSPCVIQWMKEHPDRTWPR